MRSRQNTPFRIPPPTLSFRLSRAAVGLLLATLILALLIGFSTYRNINRSRELIEDFLLKKGETVIRSLEAGSRTSMMHGHMGGGYPLHTLIQESVRENDIAFIAITDKHGVTINTAGKVTFQLPQQGIDSIIATGNAVTTLMKSQGLFTVSRQFEPHKHFAFGSSSARHMAMERFPHDPRTKIITVGLATEEFDAASARDMQHAIFMGAILFLVGSAGLYLLFIYQEMRIARSSLANLKLYTDNVIESIPAGLVTLDTGDRVISCNKKAEELLGVKHKAIYGMVITQVFPGGDVDWAAIRNTVLEHAAECHSEDGRPIPVRISGSPLMNEDGEQTGTVLIMRDMTAIREMEQQLERSRHMAALGKMAAGIAHEIRNPLGTLRGFAHYFGALPDASEQSKEYAELMKSEVDRLNRNVSGLLQFARPRDPHIAPINLDELIAKTAALTEADLAKRRLKFQYACNTNITVPADPDQLLQVLMNLLQNSIAATPEGGEVSIRAAEDDQDVRITVEDTGEGMTGEEQDKMFDPFFTTRATGTGLGLAVSHQIVEQHNGSFKIHSQPGNGTAITIILPKQRGNS